MSVIINYLPSVIAAPFIPHLSLLRSLTHLSNIPVNPTVNPSLSDLEFFYFFFSFLFWKIVYSPVPASYLLPPHFAIHPQCHNDGYWLSKSAQGFWTLDVFFFILNRWSLNKKDTLQSRGRKKAGHEKTAGKMNPLMNTPAKLSKESFKVLLS